MGLRNRYLNKKRRLMAAFLIANLKIFKGVHFDSAISIEFADGKLIVRAYEQK